MTVLFFSKVANLHCDRKWDPIKTFDQKGPPAKMKKQGAYRVHFVLGKRLLNRPLFTNDYIRRRARKSLKIEPEP